MTAAPFIGVHIKISQCLVVSCDQRSGHDETPHPVSYAPAGNNVQDNPNVNSQWEGCDSGPTEQNQTDECWEVKQTPQRLVLYEDRLIAAAERFVRRKKNLPDGNF